MPWMCLSNKLWRFFLMKISFLCLSNLSRPRFKTKESSILECWSRFKNVAFLRLAYHVILVQHTPPEPMRFCWRGLLNEIRRQFLNFFQITILLFNRQSSYENAFLEVSKNSEFFSSSCPCASSGSLGPLTV